jgi:4-hydroxybenzoyl-CoA reductase beta subunit
MRLPEFDYIAPDDLGEALRLKKEKGPAAAWLAGGTDLVVNLKQGVKNPDLLISLKNIGQLQGIAEDPGGLTIGAMTSLNQVMDHPTVRTKFPGLAEALGSVGAATLQHFAGTLGGNLLLNTRCNYFNQSRFWRDGFERCFKMGGQKCLVVEESQDCSSVCQSDGAVMLAAYSAMAMVSGAGGQRQVPVLELFSGKGETPFTLTDDEILTAIKLFEPPDGTGAQYEKISYRSAMDFPLISAGAVVTVSKGKIDRARIIVGAAAAQPVWAAEAEKMLAGATPEPQVLAAVAESAMTQCGGTIVENAGATAEYRRDMVGVAVRRAVGAAFAAADRG